ncbi:MULTISPECIES: hypothetical protein [unclassified Nodularia (in: cyanobacteria)]|uniref:hypothetical protein n=1 Tax=unclassified Nodularia (in: cyanobacteria) TaxID=2656917 RepID=UPI00187E4A65|nr:MULTISPECIES: hypothetical protein [unclassified Nodularia (in: cyanobacteria)]MBE9201863.1 hypothetical protein [Nodularia sp. LEGE 06071]MCC2693170.1 hypothetical protein [Nodularia sp. LEGE 04288]
MNYCPCCSGLLLPHIRVSGLAWFCRYCWQDMPVFYLERPLSLEKAFADKLAETIQHKNNNKIIYASKGKTLTGWIGVKDVSV